MQRPAIFIRHIETGIELASDWQFVRLVKATPAFMFSGFEQVSVDDFVIDGRAHILLPHTEWDAEYSFFAKDIALLPKAVKLFATDWFPRIVIEGDALTTLLSR